MKNFMVCHVRRLDGYSAHNDIDLIYTAAIFDRGV